MNVDDLLVKIYLYDQSFNVVFLSIETKEWSIGRKNSSFILKLVTSCRLKFTGFLLFVMEVCIAVMPHEKVFYLLDLHSRDKKGLPVPYWTFVLLKFANTGEVQRYLIETYLQKNSVLYQAQFVNIVISEEVSVDILKTYMKSVKVSNKRERRKRQKSCVNQVRSVNFNFVEKINTFKKKNIGCSLCYLHSLRSLFV